MPTREAASQLLQTAICDAICSEDPIISENAKDWLHLNTYPTLKEIIDPTPCGFIAVCKCLGLDWRNLQQSLILACEIDIHEKPKLRLVH